MRFWDESIFAVNTFEMIENGHYFSLYYNGEPDLFNTKPPLINWLQIFFTKLFGFNEFSMRLPSAIAAGLSIIFLFKFIKKYYGDLYGWITVLILLTSNGFIGFHTARTGDSDSLLSFFTLMATLSFFRYLIKEKPQYILSIFIFLTLAFATKLYASLLFLPAYLGILLYKKKLKAFLFNRYFLLGLMFFISAIFSLLYLRELETPGYLNKVFYADAGRLFSGEEFNTPSNYFYSDNFFQTRFSIWIIFFIIGSLSLFIEKETAKLNILRYFLICTVSYLTVITLSVTKLSWYDMPLYPLISVIAALPIERFIRKYHFEKKIKNQIVIGTLLISIFSYPLFLMFRQSQDNSIHYGDKIVEANEIYLFNKIKDGQNLDQIKVYYHGWNGSLLFYKYKLSNLNQTINLETNPDNFQVGDKVLVCEDNLSEELKNRFDTEIIDQYETSILYLLK